MALGILPEKEYLYQNDYAASSSHQETAVAVDK